MAGIPQPGFICVIDKDEFKGSFPAGWREVAGKQSNVDDEFTVLVQDKDFDGRDTYFEMDCIEDLNAARELIMRRLVFTTAKCQKPYTSTKDPENNVSYMRHEFAVLVNTGNAELNGQFARAFEMAERLLAEGTNFRITIALSESVKAFYNANYHVQNEDNNLTQVWGCDIYLTHGVKAPNCADTAFTCQTSPQIACWVVCFPICLITAVPYLCYKKCIKGVKEEKISQVVPVIHQKGPFQSGYSLHSLLFSPPVNHMQ